MIKIACKDVSELSCTIPNIISELEQPCGICKSGELVLTGLSPLGTPVTVRLMRDFVLEVDGIDQDTMNNIRERGCPRALQHGWN